MSYGSEHVPKLIYVELSKQVLSITIGNIFWSRIGNIEWSPHHDDKCNKSCGKSVDNTRIPIKIWAYKNMMHIVPFIVALFINYHSALPL